MHELLSPEKGGKRLLLGNEAIIRGALEANVRFVAAYPGTPSSEIIDGFARLGHEAGVEVEYSVNEKVSVESACAAAISGVRSLCSMKHVGLNVAADAFMTLAYVGVKAGMVIVTADDPSLHSSQNEQDNRFYAKMAHVPMLEPATPQEAKDMVQPAYEISERFRIPCLLRTTTRVNHCRGVVELGDLPSGSVQGDFQRDPFNLVVVPMVGRKLRLQLLEKEKQLQEVSESSPFNRVEGSGRWGIVTSGVSVLHVRDAVRELGIQDKVSVLSLGMTSPIPERLIGDFLQNVDRVMVVEELDPYLEEAVRNVAQKMGRSLTIAGKGPAGIPQAFELDSLKVQKALGRFFDVPVQAPAPLSAPQDLPARPPNLCPGCPHRATFYSIKKIFGEDAVYPTDIGCYTLGLLPPLQMADFLICMGSSVSTAGGFSRVLDRPVVAFIGDSTFFHSGMTGLVNAVTHDRNILLVIMDNGTTAMTGHQPHPGVSITPGGRKEPKVDVEQVVRGCGVQRVTVVNPLNVKKTQAALEEIKEDLKEGGVSVLISRSPCPLFERRALGIKQRVVFQVTDACDLCRDCLSQLGCPAFVWERDGAGGQCVRINETLCNGCAVCAQLCDAVKPKKLEA
ncbi:indolepyruvate ferredoxin oxidoreductase alpha subunit [Desulfacinum hydrothermale DSM 13146]|uniref:Indolepyruvate oxidoreductase subunit IorA n=1 Tax=Desulfacinum hydrothermale DSM 13146 TaxID=1121390 RepID=A0A1W1XAW6_9BACT|nr:indolepyruvate ferredoxin oxidoreductase subunit alpha [Desulfacinum hydrothermale]SMC20914.1 indolepyruvate ferredoxin oxidoreductase alpha subunit [Desulfacinum hydrothermale DSM 13146]